jgi:hypothetical protein
MHHIFKISELLTLVLQNHEDDKALLARAARTNSFFKGAALPLLWRRLESIIPLLQLLPPDAVSVQKESENVWTIVSPACTSLPYRSLMSKLVSIEEPYQ